MVDHIYKLSYLTQDQLSFGAVAHGNSPKMTTISPSLPPFAFGPMRAHACFCAHAQIPRVWPLSLVMATSNRRQTPTSYLSQIFDVELRLLIDWKWKWFWRRVLTKIRRRSLIIIWLKMKVFLTSCSDQNMTSGIGCDLIENESFQDVVFWPKYDVGVWLLFDWKWKFFWRHVLTKVRRRDLVVIWL